MQEAHVWAAVAVLLGLHLEPVHWMCLERGQTWLWIVKQIVGDYMWVSLFLIAERLRSHDL